MSDDAVVKIISSLGVDFSQAVMSAEKLAASVNVANTSLLNLQKTATAMGAITIGQAGVAGGQAQIASATETAAQATRRHTRSVQDLNQEYNVLGSQFERRAGWFVAGTAFFGSLAALKEIAVTIKDVEMGMTTIARITEDANFNFKEMRDSLQGLGVEYGMTWENVSDIAIRWSQAGYNVADTLELTKSALLALNTAELDAEYACAA